MVKHRIRPLIAYLSSVLQSTLAKNKNSDRHHNMIVELTHVSTDTRLDSEEDLDPEWRPLLSSDKLHFANVRLCNLGLKHLQSGRPLKGSVKSLYLPG